MRARAQVEFLWRAGFRRVLPDGGGPHDDDHRSLRSPTPADLLLARYLLRWPKRDVAFEVSQSALDEATKAEALSESEGA